MFQIKLVGKSNYINESKQHINLLLRLINSPKLFSTLSNSYGNEWQNVALIISNSWKKSENFR